MSFTVTHGNMEINNTVFIFIRGVATFGVFKVFLSAVYLSMPSAPLWDFIMGLRYNETSVQSDFGIMVLLYNGTSV